jgi:hypothetical protein
VIVGRQERLDLFSKWLSETALLECHFSFSFFAVRLRARLTAFSEDEIVLRSDDSNSDVIVRLERVVDFLYGDARTVDAGFEGTLVLVFRFGEVADDDDVISLTEVVS